MAIWILMALATIAMIVISEKMARARGRSVKTWIWITILTAPLPVAPLALFVLGNRE